MKNTFIIALIIVAPIVTFAQKGLQIGLVLGPQSSWLANSNDNQSLSKKVSFDKFFVGPTIDYHFLDGLGIGAELIFSFQGQEYGDGSVVVKRNVNYFKIPIVLNFNTSPEHLLMLIGKIGPEVSFLTSANQQDGAGSVAVNTGTNYSNVAIGAVAGLGLGINIKKVVILSAGIRADANFTNALISNPDPTYFDGGSSRSQTWNITAGLEFGVKVIIPSGKN